MKKFRYFIAALLSVSVIASGVALTACNGDDGEGGGNTKPIDEQTWNQAFEDIEWVNLSCHISSEVDYDDGFGTRKVENYAMMTETAMYYKMDNQSVYREVYSSKNSDGTYSTYVRYGNEGNYTLLDDTGDSYYQNLKTEIVFQVSYANDFELFAFDKDTNSFVYDGEIEVTAKVLGIGNVVEEMQLICTNNVIKASNGKIIYIKSDYRDKDDPTFFNNASFEYYDIGSTEVIISDEIRENAVPENYRD